MNKHLKSKLTMDDCKPCPNCGEEFIYFAKFNQYRPKEAVGRCSNCGYYLPIKANHKRKLVKEWNDNFKKYKEQVK